MQPAPIQLPRIFSALSDPTRLAIVERLLVEDEIATGDLAKPFDMSAPAISRHIKVLEESGLIERRVVRQFRYCRLRREGFQPLGNWIDHCRGFWSDSFDRLDAYLSTQDEAKK